jgi:hypothetical protein
MPDGGGYHVARLDGSDVAAIGTAPEAGGAVPAWNTYVAVASVQESAERAREAGATILAGPFDALPAGRGAALSAPDGASLCLWEAATRQGAQRVNEPAAWAMSILQTPDPDAARRFYAQPFRRAVLAGPEGAIFSVSQLAHRNGPDPCAPLPAAG